MGWVERGDLVVDPFGGVACGGVVCGYQGLRWVGCELEPRFVALGNQNIDLHRARMEQAGDPVPVLLQGDSRRLSEVLSGAGCVHRAMLAKEESEPSLFGGMETKRREKKSFFRRLYEKKLPPDSPLRIDHEDVLCMEKP